MLTKQGIDISFAQGLDTKTDPKRVQIGKFLRLENSVFDKGGLLQKRNGYAQLTSLPTSNYAYLTTFNENLTAIGSSIAAFDAGNDAWVNRGSLQPVSLGTLPLVRNNLNQTACDSAIAANGLVCTVYVESSGGSSTNKYLIEDSVTGQVMVSPTAITSGTGTVLGGMRVFCLGNNFIIVFTAYDGVSYYLQYIAVNSVSLQSVASATDIFGAYSQTAALNWDGCLAGGNLYLAAGDSTGVTPHIKITYLTPGLLSGGFVPLSATATLVSLAADTTGTTPVIYVSYYDSGSSTGYTQAVGPTLNPVMAAQQIISTGTILNLASAAQNGHCQVFYEVSNNYSYDSSVPSHFTSSVTVTLAGPSVSSPVVVLRSVGLASKAFIVSGTVYVLAAFQSPYQPTYFVVSGTSTSASPVVVAKLAYQNGGGYLTTGLPGVTVNGTTAQVPYLFKDMIQAVNKDTNVPSGTQTAGIYSQTGVNLASFSFGTAGLDSSEIGGDLHLAGGFLWMYDGYLPVEHNFFLWPDSVELTGSGSGGSLAAATYFYQVTYEWTDNQGNAFRSAPSVPVSVTTTGTTSSVAVKGPYLRATMKTASAVKIVIYRWSTLQQESCQVTSISSPTLNSTTSDSFSFTDTLADSSILGNNLLYTTGGVLEDVNAPATNIMTLFDTRLWVVDAEDPNLLWFSKQVIEATPVEMSDLLTLYVPPNTGTKQSTGPIRSLAVMDDKLIIGKKNAFVYVNGSGPDNTGLNNQYSQPIFITATVGCENQRSFALTPNGLMFQSDKGIWLLNRGLETSYVGAPVEDFTTGATVTSAVLVPETNQVRFTLDTGVTLMYDYYYDQWGSFKGVPAVSSCIYEDLHTFINASGAAYQESPGSYLDGSNPVQMLFQTGPIRVGDLQSYQRAYFFYLLGDYISPHRLAVSIAYDYDVNFSETKIISPGNYSPPYGSGSSQSPYGQGNPYGGPKSGEDWRVFLSRQRCQAFSIQIQEIYDPSLGAAAGAGLTLSGINAVCAFKKPFRPQPAAASAG